MRKRRIERKRKGVPVRHPTMLALAIVGGVCFQTGSLYAQSDSFPTFPPLINVVRDEIYSDNRGSIVIPGIEQKVEKQRAPVNDFAHYANKVIDTPSPDPNQSRQTIEWVNATLEEWAKANALSSAKFSDGRFCSAGEFERKVMIGTMADIALKLQTKGVTLGPHVVPWLVQLSHGIIGMEHKEEQKSKREEQSPTPKIVHPYGNPYMQRASAVAVVAILSNDRECFDFQNEAWYHGIRVIDQDGYLPSELSRGRRALTYHLRWIDYALRLRAARSAMGLQSTRWDEKQLKHLGQVVCHAFCDPQEMSKLASTQDLELPGEWGVRTIVAFGSDLLTDEWRKCGFTVSNFTSDADGGDQRIMADLYASLRTKAATN